MNKKSIIIVWAFILTISGMAMGQTGTQAQEPVTASAQVLSDLSISNIVNVDFGEVDSDLSPSPAIDPQDGTVSNQQGTATRGSADISGDAGTSVIISTPGTVTLNGPNSATMDFTPSLAFAQGHGATTGTVFTTEAQELDESGEGTVFIGGSLSNPQNIESGSYSGTFNLTVEYDL